MALKDSIGPFRTLLQGIVSARKEARCCLACGGLSPKAPPGFSDHKFVPDKRAFLYFTAKFGGLCV